MQFKKKKNSTLIDTDLIVSVDTVTSNVSFLLLMLYYN